MKKLSPCLTSLSAALCAVLIFSCSPDSSEPPTPNEEISSSSKKGSGSLEDKVPNYCVYIAERLCLRGTNPCLGNGIPSDDCPFPDAPPIDKSSDSGSPNGSNSSGVKPSSSSGAKPSSANSNGSIECNGYCQWDECVRISTDPTGEYGSVIETCEEAIENCNSYSESHQIFTTSTCKGATKPSSSSADPNASVDCNKYCKWESDCVMISTDPTGKYGAVTTTCEKAIENCEWFSPSQEAYSNLSTCKNSNSSSSAAVNTTRCKNENGQHLYCEWLTGCFAIDPAYSEKAQPCSELVAECMKYGTLFVVTVGPNITPSITEGRGLKCQ